MNILPDYIPPELAAPIGIVLIVAWFVIEWVNRER